MTLICRLRGHAEDEQQTWNQGYFFACCRRCGESLIRTSGEWHATPPGYQVAWKSGQHRHAIASDFRRNLPLLGGEPRRWRRGLHRIAFGAICLPGPPEPDPSGEEHDKRPRESGLPHILLLGLVTLLGFASRLTARPQI